MHHDTRISTLDFDYFLGYMPKVSSGSPENFRNLTWQTFILGRVTAASPAEHNPFQFL